MLLLAAAARCCFDYSCHFLIPSVGSLRVVETRRAAWLVAPGCADAVVLESNQQNLLDVIPRLQRPLSSLFMSRSKLQAFKFEMPSENRVILFYGLADFRNPPPPPQHSLLFHLFSPHLLGILLPCFVLAGSSGCVG